VALLLSSACDRSGRPNAATTRPAQASAAGEWREFGGTWTAFGTRRTLNMGPDQRAAIFELTGSLLLSGAQRPAVGFEAQAIGFSDTHTAKEGRCVWTDEYGERIRCLPSRL
jgi:hypothetical protein